MGMCLSLCVCVCERHLGAGDGPAFFLFGCQKTYKRKSGTSGGKADILAAAPESLSSAFPLVMRRGGAGREGRGLAPNGPVQALYFFLWASDRRREED